MPDLSQSAVHLSVIYRSDRSAGSRNLLLGGSRVTRVRRFGAGIFGEGRASDDGDRKEVCSTNRTAGVADANAPSALRRSAVLALFGVVVLHSIEHQCSQAITAAGLTQFAFRPDFPVKILRYPARKPAVKANVRHVAESRTPIAVQQLSVGGIEAGASSRIDARPDAVRMPPTFLFIEGAFAACWKRGRTLMAAPPADRILRAKVGVPSPSACQRTR